MFLGEPLDQAVYLRQECSSLEDEGLPKGGLHEKQLEREEDPRSLSR